jgi:hypothetical protein
MIVEVHCSVLPLSCKSIINTPSCCICSEKSDWLNALLDLHWVVLISATVSSSLALGLGEKLSREMNTLFSKTGGEDLLLNLRWGHSAWNSAQKQFCWHASHHWKGTQQCWLASTQETNNHHAIYTCNLKPILFKPILNFCRKKNMETLQASHKYKDWHQTMPWFAI